MRQPWRDQYSCRVIIRDWKALLEAMAVSIGIGTVVTPAIAGAGGGNEGVADAAFRHVLDLRRIAGAFVDLLVEMRGELRKAKQFELADSIRARLQALGVTVEDTAQGGRWRKG